MREPLLTFTLPGLPPSKNAARSHGRFSGGTYNRDSRRYFDDMALLAPSAHLKGRLWCEAACWLADRRGDVPNFTDVFLDALERGGVVENDRQVRDFRIYEAGVDRQEPRIEVSLGRLG